jgi:hypothetical protein
VTQTAGGRVNEQADHTGQLMSLPPGCREQASGLYAVDQPGVAGNHAVLFGDPRRHQPRRAQPAAGSAGQRAG